MRILVDADSCPVKEIIVKQAKKYGIKVHMYFDNSHEYHDGYSFVYILDKGADSVDYFLINHVFENDIVVTQDYGVAAMALSKKALAINQNGHIFDDENIMTMLSFRATSQKIRRHKNLKGPKKRTKVDNIKFEENLTLLINKNK